MTDTYQVQYELSKCYYDVPSFAYATYSENALREARNEADVLFCTSCEDLYAVAADDGLCFKCQGHKYVKEENI